MYSLLVHAHLYKKILCVAVIKNALTFTLILIFACAPMYVRHISACMPLVPCKVRSVKIIELEINKLRSYVSLLMSNCDELVVLQELSLNLQSLPPKKNPLLPLLFIESSSEGLSNTTVVSK